MMQAIVGIDPGIRGACAILWPLSRHVEVIDMPVIGEGKQVRINTIQLRDWLSQHTPTLAVLEHVWAMPSREDASGARRVMGASSSFKFGEVVGSIRATVANCGIPFVQVTSAKWKGQLNLRGADKEASRQRAIDLFPQHAGLFQLKKHEARAEALLLAMYGAQQ